MEEMAANIEQNADNAHQTEKISRTGVDKISSIGTLANHSLQSVKEISEKISIINDIAFQTNILALNAAVDRITSYNVCYTKLLRVLRMLLSSSITSM